MQALVVDDSESVRGMLSEHLTQLGFEVEQASNGVEALAKLPTMPQLAVVLLEWSLPDMDGLEVLRRVRTDTSHSAVPVVMVTTEDEAQFVVDAFEAGASEYLMKPFDVQTVLEKLLLIGVDPEQRRAA